GRLWGGRAAGGDAAVFGAGREGGVPVPQESPPDIRTGAPFRQGRRFAVPPVPNVRYAGALDRGWAEGLAGADMAPTSYPWQGELGALGEEARSVCRTAGGESATPSGLPMSVSAF